MIDLLRTAGAAVYAALWEARRGAYARGWRAPEKVPCRVVSIGNVTVGGTGKTTLVLELAHQATARGTKRAVVCRRYRPGPSGFGDEELMYARALGQDAVHAGSSKLQQARAAAAAGAQLVLVDDGFQHWRLARDADLVLLDARHPWDGERLLPAGMLREPRRALQRADALIVTRLRSGEDPSPRFAAARRWAPAALLAAARHRPTGARVLDGNLDGSMNSPGGSMHSPAGSKLSPGTRVRVVTATGNPQAVEESAREAGFEVTALSVFRDHHAFTSGEAALERRKAEADRALVLITAKDEVRWPAEARDGVAVLDVEWQWIHGGDEVLRLVFEGS